jgi:uncharacterized RDD family membrane protein YckC
MSSAAPIGLTAPALAWRRIAAWMIDWLWILSLPALLLPVGLALYSTGTRLPPEVWNGVSFLILILPVTLWAAWRESGRFQATPGKRVRRLAVVDARTAQPVGYSRALLRNIVKIAMPWELGHTVAFGYVAQTDGQTPAYLMALTIVVYAVMLGWLGSLFLTSTRTPYDLVSGTRVIRRP